MNVYLATFIDQMIKLWVDGLQAYDVSRAEDFMLRAILIWMMHDYPGYGVCSSLQTQGLFASLPYGPYHLKVRKLKSLRKVVYTGHWKYLAYGNTLRHHTNKKKFDNMNCEGTKPVLTTPKFWYEQWKKV
jgi:hypothetical protein